MNDADHNLILGTYLFIMATMVLVIVGVAVLITMLDNMRKALTQGEVNERAEWDAACAAFSHHPLAKTTGDSVSFFAQGWIAARKVTKL